MISRRTWFALHDLEDGTCVLPSAPDEIVHRAEDDDKPEHQRGVVHRRGRRRVRRREEAEEPDDYHVRARERVVGDAEPSGQVEGSPDQIVLLVARGHGPAADVGCHAMGRLGGSGCRGCERCGAVGAVAMSDEACAAAPEEEEGRDEVCGVEAGDGEREDVIEYRGGFQTDQVDEGPDRGDDGNGDEGDGGSLVDLKRFLVQIGATKQESVGNHLDCI